MNKKFAVSVFCFIDVFLSVSCTNTKDLKNEINKCTWYYNAMDYDDLSEYSSGDSQVFAGIGIILGAGYSAVKFSWCATDIGATLRKYPDSGVIVTQTLLTYSVDPQ